MVVLLCWRVATFLFSVVSFLASKTQSTIFPSYAGDGPATNSFYRFRVQVGEQLSAYTVNTGYRYPEGPSIDNIRGCVDMLFSFSQEKPLNFFPFNSLDGHSFACPLDYAKLINGNPTKYLNPTTKVCCDGAGWYS